MKYLPLSVRRIIWGIVGDLVNAMVEMEKMSAAADTSRKANR